MNENKPLYQAMLQAVGQTLENMAFTEALEHYDPNLQIPPEELTWTSILIHDPVQGEVRLAMGKTLLLNLTAGIFALDEDKVSQSQQDDILHELLNTIAGLFMTNLLADDQTFQLGLPEYGEGPLPELEPNAVVWKLMTPDEAPIQLYAVGASLVALNK